MDPCSIEFEVISRDGAWQGGENLGKFGIIILSRL